MYDFLIVGAGLFGATCTYLLTQQNKKVLVIDSRNHIGGNVYTENINGIHVHKYGAHIFHTSNKNVWDFINKFSSFESYEHNVIANYKDELFNLPFNMYTFYQIYGIDNIYELDKQLVKWNNSITNPNNLEEYAIKSIGIDAYKILIKGYTEKQWGTTCDKLPIDIIKRIPIRKEWNNNYYDDLYQGIPIDGYTTIISKMLTDADVELNTAFDIDKHYDIADKIIYCGSIDTLFNSSLGELPYRGVQFIQKHNENTYDASSLTTPVMNFTDIDIPYTRVINHKLFLNASKYNTNTILTYEYPNNDALKAYPIITNTNICLYNQYKHLLNKVYPKIIPGGRLGLYKYIDMDDTIELAFNLAQQILV